MFWNVCEALKQGKKKKISRSGSIHAKTHLQHHDIHVSIALEKADTWMAVTTLAKVNAGFLVQSFVAVGFTSPLETPPILRCTHKLIEEEIKDKNNHGLS